MIAGLATDRGEEMSARVDGKAVGELKFDPRVKPNLELAVSCAADVDDRRIWCAEFRVTGPRKVYRDYRGFRIRQRVAI